MDVLELRLDDGTTRKVVTRQYWERKDPENDRRPAGESSILRALAANDVPAPEAIVGEAIASEIFGRRGLVISYIDGTPNLAPVDMQDWARQLAIAMANIHSATVPPELKSIPRSHIDSVTKWLGAASPPERFARHELGPELWDAMRRLWPTVDSSASQIIHSDFWAGNTLWKDEKLLAIIDWEWPSLGEPMDDVGFFLADAAYIGYDIENSFIDAYERASGAPVHDLLFWKMMAVAIPMPDVGDWARGYEQAGVQSTTPDQIRASHADYVRTLLKEFQSNA